MSIEKDGGIAFPSAHLIENGGAENQEDAGVIAQIYYFMADAMLAERAK